MPEMFNRSVVANQSSRAFLGLESYTEKDAPFFFGRKDEIKALYQLIKYNTLTLVFGKSGTGKTSLLNAGVFPLLRNDDSFPFRIRLVFNEESPALLAQVWSLLKSQLDIYNFRIQSFIEGETLWEFFHREDLWKVVTPILLFDQFEEIFTIAGKYPGRKEELALLITELSDLIENVVPAKVKARYLNENRRIEYDYKKQRVKIILAFREDFLAEMEGITSRIPSAKNARFRLMLMNGTQAYDVITKTWKTAIDKTEAESIISYLVNEQDDQDGSLPNLRSRFEVMEIEPSLLSQVCASLDKERLSEKQDKISAEFLNKYPKENILSSIYNNALKESLGVNDSGLTGAADNRAVLMSIQKLKRFIEDNLVNEKGFREKFSYKEIPQDIIPAINGLKERFFIRQDGTFIELTHDVIAVIVKKERDLRQKAEASKAARKKALIIVAAAILVSFLVFGITSWKTSKIIVERQRKIDSLSQAFDTITVEKIRWKDRQIRNAVFIKSGDTVYVIPPYTNLPDTNPQLTGTFVRDSLINEINNFIKKQTDLESYVSLARDSIEYLNTVISGNAGIQEEANRRNQDLQNKIDMLNRNADSLKLDVSLFDTYQTHIDALWEYKDQCPPEIQARINALKKNWEPFRRRSEIHKAQQ